MGEEGGEKTEEPTPKRLREARKKRRGGDEPRPRRGRVYLGIFASLSFQAAAWITGLILYMRTAFAGATSTSGSVQVHLVQALDALRAALIAPLVAAFALAIAGVSCRRGGCSASRR